MPTSAENDSPDKSGPDAVLDFWLRDGVVAGWPTQDLGNMWFGGGAALDRDIDQRFGPQVRQAVVGGLTHWETQPLDRLALVILLDQFTRNVFRGQAQAFAGDARAQALALDALARGWDTELPLVARVFLYMPLTHAEVGSLQDECVRRLQALLPGTTTEQAKELQDFLQSARQHRDIIVRFGRFPHRNAALDRASTDAEQAYLRNGPRFGQ